MTLFDILSTNLPKRLLRLNIELGVVYREDIGTQIYRRTYRIYKFINCALFSPQLTFSLSIPDSGHILTKLKKYASRGVRYLSKSAY